MNLYRHFFIESSSKRKTNQRLASGNYRRFIVLSAQQRPKKRNSNNLKITWGDSVEEFKDEWLLASPFAAIKSHLLQSRRYQLHHSIDKTTEDINRSETLPPLGSSKETDELNISSSDLMFRSSEEARHLNTMKYIRGEDQQLLNAIDDIKNWIIPHKSKNIAIVIVDSGKLRIVCVGTPAAYNHTFRKQFIEDPFKTIPHIRALGEIF